MSVLRAVPLAIIVLFVAPAFAAGGELPSAPENVQATAGPGYGGATTVTWDPPASDGGEPVFQYRVYVDEGEGPEFIGTTPADARSYLFNPLVPLPRARDYLVSAESAAGEGPLSAPVCGVGGPLGPLQATLCGL